MYKKTFLLILLLLLTLCGCADGGNTSANTTSVTATATTTTTAATTKVTTTHWLETATSAQFAPKFYSGDRAIEQLKADLIADGEKAYCIPIKVPDGAMLDIIYRTAFMYTEFVYAFETEEDDGIREASYAFNPGDSEEILEQFVFENREIYEELDRQGRTVYYNLDDLAPKDFYRHCFVYAVDGGVITIAIPEKLPMDGELVTLTREEAMEYIDVEVVQVK